MLRFDIKDCIIMNRGETVATGNWLYSTRAVGLSTKVLSYCMCTCQG